MINAFAAGSTDGRDEAGGAAHGIGEWLCLAATPTFALMALLTAVLVGGPMDLLCSAGHGSPLNGMAPMYLLMSAFHSSPWLTLMSGRGRAFAVDGRSALSRPNEPVWSGSPLAPEFQSRERV
jgi:hypothetical protein